LSFVAQLFADSNVSYEKRNELELGVFRDFTGAENQSPIKQAAPLPRPVQVALINTNYVRFAPGPQAHEPYQLKIPFITARTRTKAAKPADNVR
jgi:hypothetical protein